MKKIINYIKKVWNQEGFRFERIMLTLFYTASVITFAMVFSRSLGNYKVQVPSFLATVFFLLCDIRSIRKLFDRKTRSRIGGFLVGLTDKLDAFVAKVLKKVAHALGIDRWGKFGDERDFVFGQRRSSRRHRKLFNPMFWQDQTENSERVRFIFIDFMIRKIKEGYQMRPFKTPNDISQELAHEDNEKLLFSSYVSARYSGGLEPIEDKTVDALTAFIETRKRRK
jgi:hypothetical protein